MQANEFYFSFLTHSFFTTLLHPMTQSYITKQTNRSLLHRSSRPEVFCKKGVLRNFAKFAGKHLCQSLFFNKVAGLKPATLLKKRFWRRCFPVNFAKFLRTPFFTEQLRWLLLTLSELKEPSFKLQKSARDIL